MAKIFSSMSAKLVAVIGASAIGYKTYSFASAESLAKEGYVIVDPENSNLMGQHKRQNQEEERVRKKMKKAIRDSRSLVDRFMTERSIPGLVIGVSFRGREVWVKGMGLSNVELGTKCRTDTVMRIASISKPITMLLVAKLIEDSKLDLDKSIHEYLTPQQFPVKKWKDKDVRITLRQLISHLGGIRHYKNPASGSEFDMPEYYNRTKYSDVFESLNMFKADDLVAEPGTQFNYTSFGWTLVSAVIESVLPAGESFGKYLINNVLRKELGMDSTYIDLNEPIIRERANNYFLTKGGVLTNCPSVENNYKIAGGGLLSTIPDLLKFGNVMMYSYRGGDEDSRRGYLRKETVEQMWRPVALTDRASGNNRLSRFFNYGMGWFVVNNDSQLSCAACASPPFGTVAFHSGAAVGASSAILVLPDQEIVVAAFCNLQNVSLSDLTCQVAQQFAAKLLIQKPQ